MSHFRCTVKWDANVNEWCEGKKCVFSPVVQWGTWDEIDPYDHVLWDCCWHQTELNQLEHLRETHREREKR